MIGWLRVGYGRERYAVGRLVLVAGGVSVTSLEYRGPIGYGRGSRVTLLTNDLHVVATTGLVQDVQAAEHQYFSLDVFFPFS